jgi:RNA polymerase Rpb6.
MDKEDFKVIVGPETITKYEYARIVGARAMMLSMGAPPFVQGSYKNAFQMAEAEVKSKLIPILIRRTLPDSQYQDIPLKYLKIPFS